MSKLLKLKEWVTLDDAARHISTLVGESVSKADVLRLGLDGHLRLSVFLVNHARAIAGRVYSGQEVTYTDWPINMFPEAVLAHKDFEGLIDNQTVKVPRGDPIGNGQFVLCDGDVFSLSGVHDIPLYGAAHIDLEEEYQKLTGGPEVRLHSLSGTFVVSGDTVYELQADCDDIEEMRGSLGELRRLNEYISQNEVTPAEKERLLGGRAEDRKALRAEWEEDPDSRWYSAAGLPNDCVLVVRTTVLADFLAGLAQGDSAPSHAGADGALKSRERNAWQAIVGALVDLLTAPSGPYAHHTAVVARLVAKYGDEPPDGLSKSNLRKVKESVDYLRGVTTK